MTAYNSSPFAPPPRLLYAGVAEHLFGSFPQNVSPTKMYVSSVAIETDIATLGVTVFEGDIPAVGSKISVQGTQNNVGAFNVTNTVLTAVNIASTGIGTVSFALAQSDFGVAGDAGLAIVPQPLGMETVANGASVPVAMSNNSFGGDLDRTVTAQAIFGTLPTAATIDLQGSMVNEDAAFETVGTIGTVAAGALTGGSCTVVANWLFYRALVSGAEGAGTYAVLIEA